MADQNALMMINPFEALETGRKRAYAGYEAGQAAAQREALNELYAQALDPRTGTIDRNKLYSGLAGRRMGAMIPGLELEEAKLGEQRGKAMQEETKGLEGRMQYWKRMIPADPRLAPAWVSAAYADPVVGPELSKFGSPEEAIAGIPQDPAQYMQWVEGASMFADEVAKRRTVTAENLLQYNQPMSPEVFEQQRALRGAGASRTIIGPAETSRSQTVGKLGGETLVNEYNAASAASRGLARDYETLDLLRKGKPATGITSELETNFARFRSAVGKDSESIRTASDSQLLEALLGSQVFEQIQALGVGARGLDTPAEREFLREVIAGTRKLDKQTLIQMAEMRAKYKEDLVTDYNSRIESGELDQFFTDFGKPKRAFKVPQRPVEPAAPKTFATEAQAEAAFKAGKLKAGDRVTIGGVSGTWK